MSKAISGLSTPVTVANYSSHTRGTAPPLHLTELNRHETCNTVQYVVIFSLRHAAVRVS